MDPNTHRRIFALAAKQNGNVTRQQLLTLGLGAEAIKYRARHGDLNAVHPGVYAVGRPATTFRERAAAAVLACGPGAVLSHLAAAQLWGFTKPSYVSTFDVTVPGDRRPTSIDVHRSKLASTDRRRHHNIWVTSPARTALDCAPLLPDRARTRLINDARLSHHLTLRALAEALDRYPHHPGRWLLYEHATTTGGATRSGWEDDFPSFCAHFGLPRPQMNIFVPVLGREVDAWFERERVAVELDGYRTHSTRQSFEDDRENDAQALANGIITVRITWTRIEHTAAREAARLGAILQSRLSA